MGVEGLGGDLGEDGIGSLAELGGGDEDADAAFGGGFEADEGVEVALAGAGEAGAVHEGGEADAAFDRAGGVGFGEGGGFGVVVGEGEGAGEEGVEVDGLMDGLAGAGGAAGADEVAAAKLFGGEAYGAGDFVHVALEREEGLRGAKAAEGS